MATQPGGRIEQIFRHYLALRRKLRIQKYPDTCGRGLSDIFGYCSMSPYICHFMQSEENTSVHYYMSLFINNNIAGLGVRPQQYFEYKRLFLRHWQVLHIK